jgi:hypothetical protein
MERKQTSINNQRTIEINKEKAAALENFMKSKAGKKTKDKIKEALIRERDSGFDIGYARGLEEGKAQARELHQAMIQRNQACTALLQQAAAFQENITRLVMYATDQRFQNNR